MPGFVREQIGININEDGTQIAISGEKPVQEIVMSGWMVHKKEVEFKGFIKVFRIPNDVVLDRIKAKFDKEESVLKIIMPKSVKGIQGIQIEELKEEEVVDKRRPEIIACSTTKEVIKPPSVGKVEETDHIMQKRADQAPEKGYHIVGDGPKEKIKEPKIEKRGEETRLVFEDEIDKQRIRLTRSQVVEELFKKGDDEIGVPKKGEESKIEKKEESHYGFHKEKVEEGKLERKEEISKREKARIQETCIKRSEETEQHKEKITTHKEETPQEVEPERELVRPQMTKQEQSEDKERKGIPERKILEENNVSESVSSEFKEPVQSQPSKQEDGIEKVERDVLDELEELLGSEKSEDEDFSDGEEKFREAETEEEESSSVDHESPKVEEKKESVGEGREEKTKPAKPRKFRPCAPCVIAGSSIIITLIVFTIHWIRSRKREVHV